MIRISPDRIEEIAHAFREGHVVVFPTETSYGIGCDATNAQAVWNVIDIKRRRAEKGLPVLVHDIEEAEEHIVFNEQAIQLAHKFWPGPLNIISTVRPETGIVSTCHKDGMQAVRHSSHAFVTELMKHIDVPIVATSANISGEESTYSADAVWDQFRGEILKPDFIVDAGVLLKNPASTMVRVVGNHVDVVRFGSITV